MIRFTLVCRMFPGFSPASTVSFGFILFGFFVCLVYWFSVFQFTVLVFVLVFVLVILLIVVLVVGVAGIF